MGTMIRVTVVSLLLTAAFFAASPAKADICGLWQINAEFFDCITSPPAGCTCTQICECYATRMHAYFVCLSGQVDCGAKPCTPVGMQDYNDYHCLPPCCSDVTFRVYDDMRYCNVCK